jgi:DNA repair exonuclease SbcCD ATPase subunit
MAGVGEIPSDDAAPAQASPDGEDAEEPLAADEPDEADFDGDADEAEDEETEVERLRRENAEFLQAQREAQAQLAERQARDHWAGKRAQVDNKLREAMAWLDSEVKSGRHYDPTEFVLRELPTIIEGYTHDLQGYHAEREAAAMNVARQHGTVTWLASLEQRFDLSKAETERVRRYPPEFMEQAAADIAAARASADPVKAELTATKSNLTKTKKALDRATGKGRMGQQIHPSPVAGALTYADVKARITPDNADEIAGPLFATIFSQQR